MGTVASTSVPLRGTRPLRRHATVRQRAGDNQASDTASEEAAALRSENEVLRAQIAGFGTAPAELEKAKERARKYKGLARELHSRLRQLTLSHCEELAVVRAQLRSAYSAAAASSATASPPLLTPSARP